MVHFEYVIDSGSRAIFAVKKENVASKPTGMNESDAGYYFAYLSGNTAPPGSTQAAQFELFPANTTMSSIPVFFRRWFSTGTIALTLPSAIFFDHAPFFILGSCVSRDAFSGKAQRLFSGYRARNSFATLHTAKLSDSPDVSGNRSPFQQRMVLGDLLRENVSLAARSPGKYVLVDFIDERIGIGRFGDTLITLSPEFRACSLPLDVSTAFGEFSEEYFHSFARGWLHFAERMASAEKSIVVNKVFWCSRDNSGRDIPNSDYIEKNNDKLKRLYSIVSTLTPQVTWIEYPSHLFVADTHHQWGLSPFHYVQTTYAHTRKRLSEITSSSTY